MTCRFHCSICWHSCVRLCRVVDELLEGLSDDLGVRVFHAKVLGIFLRFLESHEMFLDGFLWIAWCIEGFVDVLKAIKFICTLQTCCLKVFQQFLWGGVRLQFSFVAQINEHGFPEPCHQLLISCLDEVMMQQVLFHFPGAFQLHLNVIKVFLGFFWWIDGACSFPLQPFLQFLGNARAPVHSCSLLAVWCLVKCAIASIRLARQIDIGFGAFPANFHFPVLMAGISAANVLVPKDVISVKAAKFFLVVMSGEICCEVFNDTFLGCVRACQRVCACRVFFLSRCVVFGDVVFASFESWWCDHIDVVIVTGLVVAL